MPNKSQEARVAQEQANSKSSAAAKRRDRKRLLAAQHAASPGHHESKRSNRKATYVLEDRPPGTARPSRKSTRKASNRIKETSTLDIREELVQNAPKRIAARAAVKASRVSGRALH